MPSVAIWMKYKLEDVIPIPLTIPTDVSGLCEGVPTAVCDMWAVISCEWHWIFRTHPWVLWARVSMIFLDNRNPWLQLPVTVPFSLNWFHIVTFYSLTIEEAYKDFIGRELAGCLQVTFSIQNFSHGSVGGQKTTLLLTVRHLLAVYPSHDW